MAHERAGQLARPEDLIDIAELVTAYYTREVDVENPDQQVAFGTSGHRGSSLDNAFNEQHIWATTQAIVDYRREQGFDGPLFLGRDTHGLSEPAWASALEVLAANGLEARSVRGACTPRRLTLAAGTEMHHAQHRSSQLLPRITGEQQ